MRKTQTSLQVIRSLQQSRELAFLVLENLNVLEESLGWFFNNAGIERAFLYHQQLAEGLNTLSDALQETEKDRAKEAANNLEPRRARDEALRKLYKGLIESKGYLDVGLGQGSSTHYGLGGEVLRNPQKLLLLGGLVINLLETDPQEYSSRFSSNINTAFVVAELQPLHATLKAALQALEVEKVEYKVVLARRDTALKRLRTATSAVLSAYIGALILADRDDLIREARSIRKTPSRRSNKSDN